METLSTRPESLEEIGAANSKYNQILAHKAEVRQTRSKVLAKKVSWVASLNVLGATRLICLVFVDLFAYYCYLSILILRKCLLYFWRWFTKVSCNFIWHAPHVWHIMKTNLNYSAWLCIDSTTFQVCWRQEPFTASSSWGWPELAVRTEGQVGQTGACHGEPSAHDQRAGDINSKIFYDGSFILQLTVVQILFSFSLFVSILTLLLLT